jgi:transposase-like protein
MEQRLSYLVLGPGGNILTPHNLPPAKTMRWVPNRKAEVLAAIRGGLLTLAEASRRYNLSQEEFLQWERQYKKAGLRGLRATRAPDRDEITPIEGARLMSEP